MKPLKKLLKKIESFGLRHKTFSFILILSLTIIITRIFILIYNPNPKIFGFELHHFDYGMILLTITLLLMLFGKTKYFTSLTLSAVSLGLIIDGIGYIRKNLNEANIYNSTLPSSIIIALIVITAILLIAYFKKKK